MQSQIEEIKIDTTKNQKPSIQTANYCWLIAGVEMLLSCRFFIKFIHFYTAAMGAADRENIYPMCQLLGEYMNKEAVEKLYAPIEKIIFDSMDIKDFREAEDMNVVFIYMSKSKIYSEYFDEFKYAPNLETEKKYGVFAILRGQKTFNADLTEICNVNGVFSFAIKSGGHWEIYQRYLNADRNGSFFVAKNTNYLLGSRWEILVIFCVRGVIQNLYNIP